MNAENKEKSRKLKRYPAQEPASLILTQNDQSHAIEQCSDIGETVKENAKFD